MHVEHLITVLNDGSELRFALPKCLGRLHLPEPLYARRRHYLGKCLNEIENRREMLLLQNRDAGYGIHIFPLIEPVSSGLLEKETPVGRFQKELTSKGVSDMFSFNDDRRCSIHKSVLAFIDGQFLSVLRLIGKPGVAFNALLA